MSRYPLFSKIFMIGFLALLLLIPLSMIESKINERAMQQSGVESVMAQNGSGPQTLSGPYLVVTYKLREHFTEKDEHGNSRAMVKETGPYNALLTPHMLKINGSTDVETRYRGIYKARLYNLNSTVDGDFVIPRGLGLAQPIEDIIPQQTYFVMGISDSRGIRNTPMLVFNQGNYEFEAGSVEPTPGGGVHATIGKLDATAAQRLSFHFPLELQGMTTLSVQPSGNDTDVQLTSSWPHPSFGGSFLPRTHQIDDHGFKAHWMIPKLARNTSQNITENFSVGFIDPVNIYLQSQRAVKYGLMFVFLIFTAFFLFEVLQKLRIHPMQYLLVGLAMAIFFLLIISLSERISFLAAYSIAGTACTALIGFYLAGVLQRWKPAVGFSGGIGVLYGILYGVLQSEDNALLMGSVVLFGALSAVMLLTRKMDWYRLSESATAA